MDGLSKRMCSFFTVNYYLLKPVNIFEYVEIAETIYESVVEPSLKYILNQMLTVMVTAGK